MQLPIVGSKNLGGHWFKRFIERNPSISIVNQKTRDNEIDQTENYSNIKA